MKEVDAAPGAIGSLWVEPRVSEPIGDDGGEDGIRLEGEDAAPLTHRVGEEEGIAAQPGGGVHHRIPGPDVAGDKEPVGAAGEDVPEADQPHAPVETQRDPPPAHPKRSSRALDDEGEAGAAGGEEPIQSDVAADEGQAELFGQASGLRFHHGRGLPTGRDEDLVGGV